jgi:hypothetical protein
MASIMGHYSDYYEEEAQRAREVKREVISRALTDLIQFRQYNAVGKTGKWTFSELGVEREFNDFLDKVKARAYDCGAS